MSLITTSIDEVQTGVIVLQDAVKGLIARVSASNDAKYATLHVRVLELATRIGATSSKWLEKDWTGSYWLLWHTGAAASQLKKWMAESDALAKQWSDLSGEPLPATLKATDRFNAVIHGGSVSIVVVLVVALVVAGGVGVFYIWSRKK